MGLCPAEKLLFSKGSIEADGADKPQRTPSIQKASVFVFSLTDHGALWHCGILLLPWPLSWASCCCNKTTC